MALDGLNETAIGNDGPRMQSFDELRYLLGIRDPDHTVSLDVAGQQLGDRGVIMHDKAVLVRRHAIWHRRGADQWHCSAIASHERNAKADRRPHIDSALRPDPAAMGLDEVLGDAQTQPASPHLAAGIDMHLAELPKQLPHAVWGDAGACVAHADQRRVIIPPYRHCDAATLREAHSVGQ